MCELDNDKDAFWLAQVHFSTGSYTRALGFLSRQDLIARNPSCKYLAAHCYVKQSRFDEALTILGDKNPVHLITSSDRARRKLQHLDAWNGIGHAGKNGKMPQRSDRADRSEERDREDASNIRFEAAMCYLRGVCYAKQNAFDRAKECYKDAVRIDVQCFEAFEQLMQNKLMSPSEEWEFLTSLNFDTVSCNPSSAQEAAEFTKMLYTTRLSKYSRPEDFSAAIETLSTHYSLASNPSLLLSKAELLHTHCRFRDALALTTQILERDPYNFSAVPTHVACLYELNETNALFLLSHDLADSHPHEPASWFAVATYYLSLATTSHSSNPTSNSNPTSSAVSQARAYFSKSSLMDPHFGPAWIGFAHTFAAEGEHDQAISAYSTAARLFQGSHLPALFLGMQNLGLGNLALAREYLNSAFSMCNSDPLLLSELGVCFYNEGSFEQAIRILELALSVAEETNPSSTQSFLATRSNLAHALRRAGLYEQSLRQFDEVLRLGGKDAQTFTSKGLVLLELEDHMEATVALHEALALAPQDPFATELLSRALDGLQDCGVGAGLGGSFASGAGAGFGGAEEGLEGLEVDRVVEQRKEEVMRRGPRTRRERMEGRTRRMEWDESEVSGVMGAAG